MKRQIHSGPTPCDADLARVVERYASAVRSADLDDPDVVQTLLALRARTRAKILEIVARAPNAAETPHRARLRALLNKTEEDLLSRAKVRLDVVRESLAAVRERRRKVARYR